MSFECWRLTSCILITSSTQHGATSLLGRGFTAEPLHPSFALPVPTHTIVQVPGSMASVEHTSANVWRLHTMMQPCHLLTHTHSHR